MLIKSVFLLIQKFRILKFRGYNKIVYFKFDDDVFYLLEAQ